jgi:predicted transposase/invertase (TIGR01784 family)
MKHKINPTVDCVFKAILGSEENKNLLIHFLNAVLEPASKIKEIVLNNPYNEREFIGDKLTVVDVKALDENKCHYQIEIQLALHPAMSARMLYTWSSMYHSQISKGNDFAQLKPVISIWILNESLFDNVDDFHLPFVLYNQKNKLVLSKDIEIHLLQLPKWQSPQIKTEKERWIYLFKEGKNVDVDVPPEALNTDEMRQAMEVLNRFSENQDDYLLYQSRLDAILKENTLVNEMARVKRENEQVKMEREQARKREEQVQAKLDSLLLQLKEKGMDDMISEVYKGK